MLNKLYKLLQVLALIGFSIGCFFILHDDYQKATAITSQAIFLLVLSGITIK